MLARIGAGRFSQQVIVKGNHPHVAQGVGHNKAGRGHRMPMASREASTVVLFFVTNRPKVFSATNYTKGNQ